MGKMSTPSCWLLIASSKWVYCKFQIADDAAKDTLSECQYNHLLILRSVGDTV